MSAPIAPEDAVVIAEVLRRLRDVIGSLPMRADANLNQGDVYDALGHAMREAQREAEAGDEQ